ncbi:MAG: hypothetical protein AB2A00_05945 [Myxococcota bacterium]
MLTEAEGCAILKKIFEARGYSIQENVHFQEGNVSFNADGWDPVKRVGFEYMTHGAGDYEDLDGDEMNELVERMKKGELFFFIIDQAMEAYELEWGASRFLDEVERRRAAKGGA